MVILTVKEYLIEIIKPSFVHHRAMGQNQGTGELLLLDDLQGRQRLSESHLGIPKHLVATFELLDGHLDGLALFRPEDDGCLLLGDVTRLQACLSVLDGLDGVLGCFQVTAIPFVGTFDGIEDFLLDATALQDGMYLLIVERADSTALDIDGQLRMQQLIGYACRLGVLVYTLTGCILK